MAAGSGIRIGDAEREATATSLREHYSHGRLTMDEFQERLDATFAAKTDVDLAKITEDLPQANPYAAPWQPSASNSGRPGPVSTGGAWHQGRNRRSRGFAGTQGWLRVSILVVLALSLVAISISPLAAAPRLLIVLLGVLALVRRIFRRIGGRRRW